MVLFTKEGMDADNLVLVVNIPPVSFIGGPTNQEITDNIQGDWDPEILAALIATVGVPVEEAFHDIGMKYIKVVIHLECGGKVSWVMLLLEV